MLNEHSIGKRATLRYATGGELGSGEVVAYCAAPQVLVDLPSGRTWWRASLADVVPIAEEPAGPAIDEPSNLLAVVEDGRGRKWFRWSHDSHTFCPWRLVGAVHADTEVSVRWNDTGAVRLISDGFPL